MSSLPAKTLKKLTGITCCEEGFSETMYKDTLGFLTIGYGFAVGKIRMPKDVANLWLEIILTKRWPELSEHKPMGPVFKQQNEARQIALCNMSYQLGTYGLSGFIKMWRALNQGNYIRAAKEALDSQWAKQTRSRANRIAEVLRTGNLDIYRNKY